MQHQMSISGLNGNYENILSYVDFMQQLYYNLVQNQAKCLNMTVDQFKDKIHHDWWLMGQNAINNNVADSMATVGCSSELYNSTYTQVKHTFLVV